MVSQGMHLPILSYNELRCYMKGWNMSTLDTIKDILFENLDIEPDSIDEDSTFDSLNIDSLDMVELICELEDRLDIDLGEPEDIETLGQFVEYVESL